MPARKRRRYKSKSKAKKRPVLIKFLVTLLILTAFVSYIFLSSDFWDGKNKLPIAIATDGGNVTIAVFDPGVREITSVLIPGDTEVELARGLGTLRIKNVSQLGENEGLGGQLLSETLTSHFKFPVAVWADSEAQGFLSKNIFDLAKSVVVPYKTNLKLGDRARVALFSIGIQNTKRSEIDLSESSYLEKANLKDGQLGYTVSGRLPSSLLVIFSDPEISKKGLTVAILDYTSNQVSARKLGEVIEVLGAKVATVSEKDVDQFDCRVKGVNPKIAERVATLLSCQTQESDVEGNFDLQIEIGEDFAKRF